MAAKNPAPHDVTKREHPAQLDSILFADPNAPFVILKLADDRVALGSEHPEYFVRGQLYRFLGRWEDHPQKGHQFRFSTVVRDTPGGRPGLIKYLTDYAPNVGTKTAERLWDKYGPDAIRVLREEPGRVQEDRIMSLDAAKEAGAALQEGIALERTKVDLFSLLDGRGFYGKAIDAAIAKWGVKAPETIRENPFVMIEEDIPSAGFRRCDKLYLELGYPADRIDRQVWFLWAWMRDSSDGHTWNDGPAAVKALREGIPGENVNPKEAIIAGRELGRFRLRKDEAGKLWIAEAQKAIDERRLAVRLWELMNA